MDLGMLGAFAGGVLTLLSPCSVMLLPAFFSYAFTDPVTLLTRTGVFYLGLVTTLVPMGVLAGTLGALVNQHRSAVVTSSSVVVIALGLMMVLNVPLPFLSRSGGESGTSTASVYALGTVYGLAGVCAGPLLGAALTLAALGGSALYGGVVLLVFAAGMVLPLLVLALLWARLPAARALVRPRELRIGRWRGTWTGVVSGVLTMAVGILLLWTQGTASLGGALGASDQVALEGWVRRTTDGVPDVVVVGAAATVVVIAVIVRRSRLRAQASDTQSSTEP